MVTGALGPAPVRVGRARGAGLDDRPGDGPGDGPVDGLGDAADPCAERGSRRGSSRLRGPASRDALAAALLCLTWALVVLPRTVQSLTAPKHRTAVGVEAAPYSALALLSDRGLTLAVAAACALAVLLSLRRLTLARAGAVAVLLAPWLVAAVRDAYAGLSPDAEAALYPSVVLALWALAPRLRVGAVVGHLAGASALLALVLGVALPRAGLYRLASGDLVDPDKALLPLGLLIGPFSDSNNLAQVLVLGAPALLLVRRRAVAIGWLVVLVAALVWTSSRSSLVALVAAGAVVGVTALARRPWSRAALAGAGGLVAVATVVVVPLLTVAGGTSGAARATAADTAFTNRGYVWRLSLEAVAENPLAGLGTGWYGQVARYANPLGGFAYHGHNVMVQTLVTTGLVGLAALAVLAVVALLRAARWASAGLGRAALFPVAHLVALAISSTLEVSFATVDRGFLLPVALAPLALWLLARGGAR